MRPYILMALVMVTLAGCASSKQCPGWPGALESGGGVHGPASQN